MDWAKLERTDRLNAPDALEHIIIIQALFLPK
jgi:hypothetical protein